MLAFSLLAAVASAVVKHYCEVQRQVKQLETAGGALKQQSVHAPFPPPPGPVPGRVIFKYEAESADLRDYLGGLSQPDRERMLRRPHGYWGWNVGEGRFQRIALDYWTRADIQDAGGRRIVAFEFDNRSEWDYAYRGEEKSLAQRAAERKAHRLALRTLAKLERCMDAGTSWESVKPRYDRAVRLDPGVDHFRMLRTSRRAKLLHWAQRAGDAKMLGGLLWPGISEAQRRLFVARRLAGYEPRCLGPIVLWPRTTAEEVTLKMAMLSSRLGVVAASETPMIIAALQRFLGIRYSSHAREVFTHATLSEKGLGYVGDISHVSFGVYLQKVSRTIRSAARLPAASLSSKRVGAGVRFPEESSLDHPWAHGRPALLARLAIDYKIDTHIARQWVRDGKLQALECKLRCEWAACGEGVRGRIEVPTSERRTWERLCVRYVEMKRRKDVTSELTATAKKKAYRHSRRPDGGALKAAAAVVRDRAALAGV